MAYKHRGLLDGAFLDIQNLLPPGPSALWSPRYHYSMTKVLIYLVREYIADDDRLEGSGHVSEDSERCSKYAM